MTFAESQLQNPQRALAWRWERAHWLLDHARNYSQRRDDAATGRALSYLRALRRGVHTTGLARRFPALAQAHRLYVADGPVTHQIEARLLARQAPAEVAARVALPAEVVGVFEATFFHVGDRLDARDWITRQAIGWWQGRALRGRKSSAVLKAYAYHGGLAVLEAALPYLLRWPDVAGMHFDPATPEGRLGLSLRLAITLDLHPEDGSTEASLWKLLPLLRTQAPLQPAERATTAVPVPHSLHSLTTAPVDIGERPVPPVQTTVVAPSRRHCA